VKIRSVRPNNRRRAFELATARGELLFPYSRLRVRPGPNNRVREAYIDPDLGHEGFTYVLEDGSEGSVHVDAVLDYNRDPEYLQHALLYRLTLEAQRAVAESDLSRREIIRRLGTSASQFYRLLDPTHYRKSITQLLALLAILDRDVDFVVRRRA
jgi:hypothetical protein